MRKIVVALAITLLTIAAAPAVARADDDPFDMVCTNLMVGSSPQWVLRMLLRQGVTGPQVDRLITSAQLAGCEDIPQ